MASDLIRMMHALFLPAAYEVRDVHWHPSADVYRTPEGWLVKFDLAGVQPEDARLSLRGSRLTVSGTRRDWCVGEGCSCYQMEISSSHFERSLDLPGDLERAHVTAEHRDGMLLVRIRMEDDR